MSFSTIWLQYPTQFILLEIFKMKYLFNDSTFFRSFFFKLLVSIPSTQRHHQMVSKLLKYRPDFYHSGDLIRETEARRFLKKDYFLALHTADNIKANIQAQKKSWKLFILVVLTSFKRKKSLIVKTTITLKSLELSFVWADPLPTISLRTLRLELAPTEKATQSIRFLRWILLMKNRWSKCEGQCFFFL